MVDKKVGEVHLQVYPRFDRFHDELQRRLKKEESKSETMKIPVDADLEEFKKKLKIIEGWRSDQEKNPIKIAVDLETADAIRELREFRKVADGMDDIAIDVSVNREELHHLAGEFNDLRYDMDTGLSTYVDVDNSELNALRAELKAMQTEMIAEPLVQKIIYDAKSLSGGRERDAIIGNARKMGKAAGWAAKAGLEEKFNSITFPLKSMDWARAQFDIGYRKIYDRYLMWGDMFGKAAIKPFTKMKEDWKAAGDVASYFGTLSKRMDSVVQRGEAFLGFLSKMKGEAKTGGDAIRNNLTRSFEGFVQSSRNLRTSLHHFRVPDDVYESWLELRAGIEIVKVSMSKPFKNVWETATKGADRFRSSAASAGTSLRDSVKNADLATNAYNRFFRVLYSAQDKLLTISNVTRDTSDNFARLFGAEDFKSSAVGKNIDGVIGHLKKLGSEAKLTGSIIQDSVGGAFDKVKTSTWGMGITRLITESKIKPSGLRQFGKGISDKISKAMLKATKDANGGSSSLGKALSNMLGAGFKRMKDFARPLTEGFSDAFSSIARMTRGFGGVLSGSLTGIMTGVRNMSSNFTSALDGSLGGVGRGLAAAVTPALSKLKTKVFRPISEGLSDAFSRGVKGAKKALNKVTGGWSSRLGRTFAPATKAISRTFGKAFKSVKSIGGRAFSVLGSAATKVFSNPIFKKGANAVFRRLGEYASGASRMAIGAFAKLGGFLMKSLMPMIMSIGVSLMAVFGQVLLAQILAIGGAIGSVVSGAALFAPALVAGLGASLAVLKVGLDGVKESVSSAFSAETAEDFESAIADMHPKVQEIARAFRAFKPAMDEMKDGIQTNLLDGLAPGITSAMDNLMPVVSSGAQTIAKTWNSAFQDVLTELSSSQAQTGMATILANTAKMGENMRPILANLTEAFGSLAEQGSKFLPEFGTWAADISESFRSWAESLKEISPETGLSKFDETVEKAKVNAGYLKDIFGGLFGTLGNVFSAAEASGGGLLKSMGDNMQHLKEITEKGTEGYDKISGFMTNASGMMEQVGTLMGPILSVLTNVGGILTRFGEAVIPGLVPVLEGLAKGLEPILDVAAEVGETIGGALEGFGPLLESLGTALAPLLTGLANGIAPMLEGLTTALQPLFDRLPALMEAFAPVLETVGKAFGDIFIALSPIIGEIMDAIISLMPLLEKVMGVVGDVVVKLLEALTPLFESGIIEKLVDALMPLVDVLGDALIQIIDALAPIMPILADAFFRLVEALIPILPALAEIVIALLPPLLEIIEALIPILEPVIDLIIAVVENVLPILIDIVKMVADSISIYWSAIAGAIEVAVGIITPIIEGLIKLVKGIGKVFNRLWEDFVKPVWDDITRIIQGFVDFFKNIITGDFQGAIDSIGEIFGGVKDLFTDVKDFIFDLFKDAGSWLLDTGKDLVDGLLNGIGNIGEAIGNWILDRVPGPIKSTIKSVLGLEEGGEIPPLAAGGIVPLQYVAKFASGGRLPTSGPGTNMTDGILGVNGNGVPTARVNAGEFVVNAKDTKRFYEVIKAINAGDKASAMQALQQVPGYAAGGLLGGKNPLMDLVSQAAAGSSAMVSNVSSAVGAAVNQAASVGAGAFEGAAEFGTDLFSGVTTSWDTVSANLTAAWSTFQTEAATVFGNVAVTVDTAWGEISSLTMTSWNDTNSFLSSTWSTMLSTATETWSSTQAVITNAWDAAGQAVVDGWDNHFSPTFSTLQDGLATLSGWFDTTVDNIGAAWDRLRPKTGTPAKFVVETVFNNGIRNAWNAIASMIDEKEMGAVGLGNLGRYATGGVLPGYTPGKDVHRFRSPTGGTLDLSGGEAIMRPEWTRAVGGPQAVNEMNALAMRGQLSNPKGGGTHQAHANGGIFSLPHQAFASGGTVATGDTITPIQQAMWDVIRSAFPGAVLTSATRNYDVGSGYDFHMQGKAIDLGGPMAQMNQWIAKKYGSSILEMFYDPGANIDEGRPMGPIGGHGDHVHWAMDSILDSNGINVVSTEGGSVGGAPSISMADMVQSAWDAEINKIPDFSGSTKGFGGTVGPLKDKMASKAWDYVSEKAADLDVMSGGLVSTAGIQNGSNREMGKQMAARVGWTGDKWNALDQLWQHESGWNHLAQNPSSTAYGIPQFLDSTWGSVGVAKTSDPKQQIAAGIKYIQQRPDYQGDPRSAWSLWNSRSPHWYDQGGLATGVGVMQKNVLEPERVLSPNQTRAFNDFVYKFLPTLISDFRRRPFSIKEGVNRIIGELRGLPAKQADYRQQNIDRMTDSVVTKFTRQIDGKGALNPIDTNYDAGWIDRNGNKLQANISAAIASGSTAASDPWGYLAAEQAAKDRIDAEAEEAEKKRAEAEQERTTEETQKADEERKAERDKQLEDAGDDEDLKKTLQEGFDKEDAEAKTAAEADKAAADEKAKAEDERIAALKESGEFYYGHKVFGDDGSNPNEYERSEAENMAWEGGTQFANALGLEGGDKLSKRVSMLQSLGSAVTTATPAWIAAANGNNSGLSHNIAVGTASALGDARSGAKEIGPGLVASALEGVLSTASLQSAPLVGTVNSGMTEAELFQTLDRYETRSARKRGGTPRRL